jgi:hypothetical protein
MPAENRAYTSGAIHPEIARFRREFDTNWIPDGVEFMVEGQRIRGERHNTDWSRLGLATGAFAALAALGVGMVWIPVFNYAWALATLAILVALPYIGARAAIFRLRKGRKKVFELDFSEGAPRWYSNDDRFWKHVKDFFKV